MIVYPHLALWVDNHPVAWPQQKLRFLRSYNIDYPEKRTEDSGMVDGDFDNRTGMPCRWTYVHQQNAKPPKVRPINATLCRKSKNGKRQIKEGTSQSASFKAFSVAEEC